MNINKLIDIDYDSVADVRDFSDLSDAFINGDYLAVLNDELETVGIVTLKDICIHRQGRIRDCDILKPHVTPDHSIEDVLQLLKQAGTDHLPVYRNADFLGVISLMNIADSSSNVLNESRLNYQKVIHDVRNPIGNLRGLVNMVSQESDDPELLDITHLCELSCDQALNILEDLLHIETDEVRPLNKQPTEMNEFYRACINEQSGLGLLKQIKVENNVGLGSIVKQIDRDLLKRAVQNIISNAIKFSHQNSVVKVSSKIEGTSIILKIVDSGLGIPAHLHQDLFTKFSSAQRKGTSGEASTGLGLYFTKQAIERHAGELTFKSVEGRGTKFYLKL